MTSLKGRATSLFAWGLLVGGVALLATFADGMPPERFGLTHLPAAMLFGLGGIVFGLTHPEGRAWIGGVFLGWVPVAAGVWSALSGGVPSAGVLLVLLLVPACLAGLGAWAGAVVARRRS